MTHRRDPLPPPSSVPFPPSIERVRHALGGGRDPKPPTSIAQIAFDCDDGHLRRLADSNQAVQGVDALDYALDIRYTPIHREFFLYAFPRVLEQYRLDLIRGDQSMFRSEFEAALAHTCLLDRYKGLFAGSTSSTKYPDPLEASPDARREVLFYLAGTILEHMERVESLSNAECQRKPEAISNVALFGVYSPIIEPLWNTWWSFETLGRARVGVLWLSSLVYHQWTSPFWPRGLSFPLWCDDGYVFGLGWKPPNTEFLRKTLTMRFVEEAAAWAMNRLEGTPDEDAAAILVKDIGTNHEIVASRIAELPTLVAMPNEPADEKRRWTI